MQEYEESIAEKTKSKPELKPKVGAFIAERTKLRRQRYDEIANKEKMIDLESFRKYFGYLSPSDMYKNLNKAIDSKENKAQINAIKDKLANLI